MNTGLLRPVDARRGSVMLCVLLFVIVVAGVALCAVLDSLNARQVNRREEAYSDGLSTAEYGAELAISEIANGLVLRPDAMGRYGDLSIVDGDWVLGADNGAATLFESGGVTDPEQRRISGFFNNHEFRVRVRSARRGHDPEFNLVKSFAKDQYSLDRDISDPNKPLPSGWLWNPGEFAFGKDKLYSFRDVYEITATARPRNATVPGAVNPVIYSEPAVMAVVEYSYDSPLADLMKNAALIMENPAYFAPTVAFTRTIDPDKPLSFTSPGLALLRSHSAYAFAAALPPPNNPVAPADPVQQLKTVYSINISGEDHDIRKQNISRIVSDTITTPLRLMTTDARFFTALGGYWSAGQLSLNFIDIDPNRDIDVERKFKDIAVTNKDEVTGATVNRTVRIPVPNPHRPVTQPSGSYYPTGYVPGANEKIRDNAAMWAEFNDGRTLDTYLLGGKQAKTVSYVALPPGAHTVNSSSTTPKNPPATGFITSDNTASKNFAIVLGAFEDLPRLYINMAGGPSGSNPNQPATWSQMYVGQYTKSPRKTNAQESSLPLLRRSASDVNKIRPQTIHMLLNSADDMLVREYEYTFKTGTNTGQTVYFAHPASGSYTYYQNTFTGAIAFNSRPSGDGWPRAVKQTQNWTAEWKGNYTWATTDFMKGNNGTVKLTKTVNAAVAGASNTQLSVQTQKSNTNCVPRQFFWQELVGYALQKDYSAARYGEPALIDDGLGYPENNNDKNPTSRRTYAYEDANGNKKPVGFDEAFQRNPKYRSDPARWRPKNNASGVDYPSYLVDAWDPISVRNPVTGELEDRNSMDDFLFKKTFIMNKDEDGDGRKDEIERDALCLFIGYEDQVEWTADYNYTDMVFSIYVAPTVEKMEKDVITIAATSKQWWERDETEGLSGKDSHPAIGVNMQLDIDFGIMGRLPDEKLRGEHFKRFNHDEKEADGENSLAHNIWTMHGNQTDALIDFPRAAFVYNQVGERKYNTGRLDTDNEVVAKFLGLAVETGKPKVFYYTKSDLVDYMQWFVKDNNQAEVEKWYDVVAKDWRYDLAASDIAGMNSGIEFRPIDERYGIPSPDGDRWDDKDESNQIRTARASLEAKDAFDALIVSREPISIRKLAAGIIGSSVESVPVVKTKDFGKITDAVVSTSPLGFIAGEIRHDSVFDMTDAGLRSDGVGIPIRSDELVFPELEDDGLTYRTDRAKAFFAAPTPLDSPDRAALDAAAAQAVDECYVDFYAGAAGVKQTVQETYGIKEERYSIGFHRSGKEFEYRKDYSQDRMEVVALGVTGFNPFRTTVSAPAYIASEEFGDAADPSYGIASNYDAEGGAAPTFVFDRPIDGAGALVVNGNLHIKSTFAYYGILVVLGDLIIEPTLHEGEFVYNSEGNPVDRWGNTLYRDSVDGPWRYDPADIPVDENGNRRTNPEPALQDVYRGELIAQGMVAVKGRVIARQTEEPGIPGIAGITHTGCLNVYWSRAAVEDAGGVVSRGQPQVRRVLWLNNQEGRTIPLQKSHGFHDISVDNIWQDKTDIGNPIQ